MSKKNTVNISIGKNAAPWLKDLILASIPQHGQTINITDHNESPAQEPKPWDITPEQQKKIKGERFAEMAEAEPVPFLRIYGEAGEVGGDRRYLECDNDGDVIESTNGYFLAGYGQDILFKACDIQILIHADTDHKTARRLLKKMLEMIESVDETRFESEKPFAPQEICGDIPF